MGKTHNPCALPPLTTEDHVPPEELLLDCWVTGTSPGALWDMKSTPALVRQGGTLWARGVRWDFGDILGGPEDGEETKNTNVKQNKILKSGLITPTD